MNPPSKVLGMKQVYIASMGLFITYIDSTIINVALPDIMGDYQIGLSLSSWLVNAFVLTLAVLMIAMGKMAQVFGSARIYTLGLVLFMLSSAMCGIAPTVELLIVSRILQGVAGAMIIPTSMALAREAVPKEHAGKAIGIWGAIGALGAAGGPPLGGFITEALGWRWIFFLNVPIIVAVLPFTWRMLKFSRHERKHVRIDFTGMVSIGASIFFLNYAILQGEEIGWLGPEVLIFLVMSVVSFAIFIWIEKRKSDPLVSFALFRNRQYVAGLVSNLLAGMLTMGSNMMIPEYLVQVKEYPMDKVAMLTTLLPLTSLLLGPLIGKLVDRTGFVVPLLLGYGCALTGFTLLFWTGTELSIGGLAAILLVTGTGNGILMITCVALSTSSLPPGQLAMGSGIFSMIRNVGGSLGVALMVSVALSFVHSPAPMADEMYQASKLALASGMKAAFFTGTLVTLLFSPSLLLLRQKKQTRVADEKTYVG